MIIRRLAWLLILGALLVSLPVLAATDEFVPGKCSQAMLKGRYGVIEQATVLAPLPGAPAPPFAAVNSVLANYDGAGNVSGTYTSSFGGLIVPGTFSGTYTVASDCTYTDQLTSPQLGLVAHHTGTITAGLQVNAMYTDSMMVGWGTGKRIPAGGCSPATLQGAYGLQGQGTVYGATPGLPPPPFPGAHIGVLTADGAGNMTGSDTMMLDGVVMPDIFTVAYTVRPNCAYTSTITTSIGVFHETGVITGTGKLLEINKIMTDPGMVWVDTVRVQ